MLAAIIFVFAAASYLSAQQIPSQPSPPSFGTGLTAPTVTAPTVSPVTAPVFSSGTTGSTNGTAAATGSGSAASGSGASGSATGSALAMSSLLGDSSNSLLSTLLGEDTAETGTTDDQLLNQLMSILQGGSGTTDAGSTAAALASSAVTAAAAGSAASGGNSGGKSGIGVAATGAGGRENTSGADIARFSLGAYDVTPTISLLLTSNIAANGTFLLSGDRSYLVSGRTLRENFYFLCRREADGSYTLHADVVQETANEWSACRRLAKLGAVKGEAAGNQILFRATDSAGPIYLLLSLFGPTADTQSVR